MKNNRKNRKLRYIRAKNSYLRGRVIKCVKKISNEFLRDTEISQLTDIIQNIVDMEGKKIGKVYKYNPNEATITMSHIDDDYTKDLKTLVIGYKRN